MNPSKKGTIQRLREFAKPCKGLLASSVVLAALAAFFGIIPYAAVSQIISNLMRGQIQPGRIMPLVLLALFGYLASLWLSTYSTIRSHRAAFTILAHIRKAIFLIPLFYRVDRGRWLFCFKVPLMRSYKSDASTNVQTCSSLCTSSGFYKLQDGNRGKESRYQPEEISPAERPKERDAKTRDHRGYSCQDYRGGQRNTSWQKEVGSPQ